MSKYVIMQTKENDIFNEEFDSKEEALKRANNIWTKLSKADKKKLDSFYVLESVNPDEESVDHFDGDMIKDYFCEEKTYEYLIRDKEAGNIIAYFETLEEAEEELKAYEDEDRKDGTFTPDFYEIVAVDEI